MSEPTCRRLAAACLTVFATLPVAAQAQPTLEAPADADIVVTATRTPQSIQQIGSAIDVITAEEIEKSSVKDVSDVIRRVPGVTLTQAGGPGRVQTVRIRGGDVRHTLVLIDGIRVNDPSSTGREFDFSNLVLADVERIEVLRGPQSALYGSDALGGVINIITKRGSGPPRGSLSVEAGRYGTKEMKGSVSGGNEQVDYSFGFAGFDTAGFSAFGYRVKRLRPLAPIGGFEPDNAQRFGFAGRIGANLTDGLRLEVGGNVSRNRAQYDAAFLPFPDTPSQADSTLMNGYARLIADSFGGALRSTVTAFANRTDRETRDVTFTSRPRFLTPTAGNTEFIGDRRGAEYQGDLKLGPIGLLTLGARIEEELADSFRQNLTPPGARQRTIAAEQTTRSLFALHQVTVFERLHLSLGGRIDDVLDVERFATWRATAAYEIPETGTKLRTSAGTGGKAPSLFQLYSPSFGTPGLEPEHSFGADAGIDQTVLGGAAKLSGTLFLNRYRNLIDFTADRTRCRPSQTFGCYFNVARARTSGAELAADIKLVPEFLRVRVAYTALEAIDVTTGDRLARRPAHEGRVGFIVTPTSRLSIEPAIVFVGSRFNLPNEKGKLPPYARFDLYTEYRLNDTFSIFGRGENLTNARFEEVRDYGTTGRALYGGIRATW